MRRETAYLSVDGQAIGQIGSIQMGISPNRSWADPDSVLAYGCFALILRSQNESALYQRVQNLAGVLLG